MLDNCLRSLLVAALSSSRPLLPRLDLSVSERLAIPKESLAKVREDSLKDPKLADDPQVAQGQRFWNVVQADYSAGVDYVPPTITFDRRMTLDLGDVSVYLFSFGQWH
jgi:hypothetical protein